MFSIVIAQQNPSISYITKEQNANIGDTIDLHCAVHYASQYPVSICFKTFLIVVLLQQCFVQRD